jgi:hypothetical protein
MAEVPTLPDILDAAIDRRLEGLHTSCPGIIQSYSAANVTATVQPSIPDAPALKDVPVAIPGAWASGDPVLLVYCEREFDSELADAGEERRHGVGAAIAVPLVARPGDTVDFVALATKVETAVTDLLDGIIDAAGSVTAPGGGPAFVAALQAFKLSWESTLSVAAEKLKAR